MKSNLHKILPYVLKPLSWVYGIVTDVRNWLFEHNIFKQESFDVPVVSIGNLTVGGTGKTPHAEYVAGMLASTYKIAVLSRGYKRKTKGFILANSNSTPETVGDEPLQIFKKHGERVRVAVCENRRNGIREILRQFPDTQLIVLDDAFQHRYVKPKVNILLMDYNHPVYDDHLLPLGRLRENWKQSMRADMIVVTKCPPGLQPLSYRLIYKKLEIMPYQKLYFSNYVYGSLTPVYPDDKPYYVDLASLSSKDTVMLVTGVANPRGFIRHFGCYPFKCVVCHFPDHHDFSREDVKKLYDKFQSLKGERKLIITTEKDSIRLAYNPYIPASMKPFMFYIPISVRMISGLNEDNFIGDLMKSIDSSNNW